MIDFDAATTALVEADVDRTRVGVNWPRGLAQLIEAHEKKHHGMVHRKQIHVLIDRYVERYFPGTVVEYADRHEIISTVQNRYFERFKWYFAQMAKDRQREAAKAAEDIYKDRVLISESWPFRVIQRPPAGWKFER